ncbi:YkgB family protein [Pseudonocardia sp. CA-142604]|uniref:YkgB family protein n=1 Tax=Pseudonocardia sp. CA-142604 TaxID=3240024 RepID=UPI003D8DB5DC
MPAATEFVHMVEERVSTASAILLRYGLAVVIAWIGALKFTGSEAVRIQQYVAPSPLMSWMDSILAVRTLSGVLGTVEIAAAVLICLRLLLPRISVVGSVLAILLFLSTLSFLFTTPGVGDATAGGFPALSPVGQFLIKDLVLLGASVWTLGDSLLAGRRPGTPVARR